MADHLARKVQRTGLRQEDEETSLGGVSVPRICSMTKGKGTVKATDRARKPSIIRPSFLLSPSMCTCASGQESIKHEENALNETKSVKVVESL